VCNHQPRPRPPEPVTMNHSARVKTQKALENRDYVRKLLSQRQPKFAGALAAASQELTCRVGQPQPGTCRLCGRRPASPKTSGA